MRERNEWKFFAALPRASRGLAAAWWAMVVARGVLPAAFAIAMGAVVASIQRGEGSGATLALVGAIFVAMQVLAPIHQSLSSNLGDRTSSWLYDRLTQACVTPP